MLLFNIICSGQCESDVDLLRGYERPMPLPWHPVITPGLQQRIRRANAKVNIIQTRGVIEKKKKPYYDILCENCKFKVIEKFCSDCKKKYKKYKNNKARKAKLSNKSDRSNSTKLIRLNSDGSGNNFSGSENVVSGSSDSFGTINKISKYANKLCESCQNKFI